MTRCGHRGCDSYCVCAQERECHACRREKDGHRHDRREYSRPFARGRLGRGESRGRKVWRKLLDIAGGNDSEVKSVGFCRRGKHLLFCFYYIIKFEKSQILEAKRSEAGKKGGKGKRSKGKKKTEQNRKIGYGERGGGMAVWRFQILPFPRNHSPL